MLLERELQTIRSVSKRDALGRFFCSQTRWELLLLIASNQEAEEIGIWTYIGMLSTRTESPMTIYGFIRDRIDDGSLVLRQGRKKSAKILGLSPQLQAALADFLELRYAQSVKKNSKSEISVESTLVATSPVRNVGARFRDTVPISAAFLLPDLTENATWDQRSGNLSHS